MHPSSLLRISHSHRHLRRHRTIPTRSFLFSIFPILKILAATHVCRSSPSWWYFVPSTSLFSSHCCWRCWWWLPIHVVGITTTFGSHHWHVEGFTVSSKTLGIVRRNGPDHPRHPNINRSSSSNSRSRSRSSTIRSKIYHHRPPSILSIMNVVTNTNGPASAAAEEEGAAAASAAVASLSAATAISRPPRVVVIGAGFSGLSVAYHLLLPRISGSSGSGGGGDDGDSTTIPRPEVLLFEARDRIGGRVHPHSLVAAASDVATSKTTMVDLGGQWVHEASDNNPLYRLIVHDLGLRFVTMKEPSSKGSNVRDDHNVIFDEDGSRIPIDVIRRANGILNDAIGDSSDEDDDGDDVVDTNTNDDAGDTAGRDNANNDVSDDDDVMTSFRDLVEEQIKVELAKSASPSLSSTTTSLTSTFGSVDDDNGRTTDLPMYTTDVLRRALNGLIHEVEEYEGSKLEEMSANEDWYVNLGGPDEVVLGSYHAVLEGIVTKMTCPHLVDHGSSSDGAMTGDMKNFVAAAAAPPTREELIRLNARVTKIEYSNDDDNNKKEGNDTAKNSDSGGGIIVTFEDTTKVDCPPTTVHCDYCVCTIPLGVLQQPGSVEFVPPLPPSKQTAISSIGMGLLNKIVMQFEHKFWSDLKQFAITNTDPALVKTYYDSSEDFGADAILVQFLAGHAAQRVDGPNNEDSISDEDAVNESLEALRLVFGRETVPNPIATMVTRWRQDEYARGAYSFAKVGSTATMFDDLAEPVGNLLFAGEHTSKAAHSTVHGAWMSGQREAERIQVRMREGM